MDTATEIGFADGAYRFWLPMPQILELERKCGGKSIFVMFDQIGSGLGLSEERPVYLGGGSAMVTDIREIIRLALIGGNSAMIDGEEKQVGPNAARQLVEDYIYPARPLVEALHLAWAILHAAINGIEVKKKAEPVKGKSRSSSPRDKS
ncbi:MAG: hypothetical protein EP345_17475 [Sphingomonadales bacterium]|nr:MAG: hypothetical protein EP345_17475 [Sphingomonadales bacterium]